MRTCASTGVRVCVMVCVNEFVRRLTARTPILVADGGAYVCRVDGGTYVCFYGCVRVLLCVNIFVDGGAYVCRVDEGAYMVICVYMCMCVCVCKCVRVDTDSLDVGVGHIRTVSVTSRHRCV